MFEVIATVCLLANVDTCRDVLIPGFEQADATDCIAHLELEMPSVSGPTGPVFVKNTTCQPIGDIAKFQKVSNGVFAHRGAISDAAADNFGDVSNSGFVIGETSVAVIDTGGSRKAGEAIYRAIRQETDLPIDHVILTHMHPDHVLGASIFADLGARIIGHAKLTTALSDRAESYMTSFGELIGPAQFIGTRVVLPEASAQEMPPIDLGGRMLELRAWQTSHTTNDVTVFDPATGVMFTGDLVFHIHAPALDGSLRGWVDVLEEMEKLPIRKIVPGHGGPVLDWPDGARDLRQYLSVLIRDTRRALARGESLITAADNIATEEAQNWELFELFNARNATVAYTELEWE